MTLCVATSIKRIKPVIHPTRYFRFVRSNSYQTVLPCLWRSIWILLLALGAHAVLLGFLLLGFALLVLSLLILIIEWKLNLWFFQQSIVDLMELWQNKKKNSLKQHKTIPLCVCVRRVLEIQPLPCWPLVWPLLPGCQTWRRSGSCCVACHQRCQCRGAPGWCSRSGCSDAPAGASWAAGKSRGRYAAQTCWSGSPAGSRCLACAPSWWGWTKRASRLRSSTPDRRWTLEWREIGDSIILVFWNH